MFFISHMDLHVLIKSPDLGCERKPDLFDVVDEKCELHCCTDVRSVVLVCVMKRGALSDDL